MPSAQEHTRPSVRWNRRCSNGRFGGRLKSARSASRKSKAAGRLRESANSDVVIFNLRGRRKNEAPAVTSSVSRSAGSDLTVGIINQNTLKSSRNYRDFVSRCRHDGSNRVQTRRMCCWLMMPRAASFATAAKLTGINVPTARAARVPARHACPAKLAADCQRLVAMHSPAPRAALGCVRRSHAAKRPSSPAVEKPSSRPIRLRAYPRSA